MPRLFIVTQSYSENIGSFSGYVENLSKFFCSKKYGVTILCGQKNKQENQHESLSYAKVIRFPQVKLFFLNNVVNAILLSYYVKKYFKSIKLEHGDIIFANGEASLGVKDKNFILRTGDQPVKIYLKNMEMAADEVSIITRSARFIHLSLLASMEKTYFKKASLAVYSSEKSKTLYESQYNQEKPYFIPRSGVNYDLFQKNSKMAGKEDYILFVSSGAEKIRKGAVYLEKILPFIFDKYKNIDLLHVGEKFKWNVDSKYLSRINSVGKIPWDQMYKYYNRSKLMIIASINEGMPNILLESMASGVPVVSSNIEGIEEYIGHKEGGYIYPRGDTEELKRGIMYFLENPLARDKAKKCIKKKAKTLDYHTYFTEFLTFIINTKNRDKKNINLLWKK